MTVIFTSATNQLIAMTVDSAVTCEFQDLPNEYDTGRKVYHFPGVGCVATWGARDHNHIGRFLDNEQISPEKHTVDDLADLVYYYLTKEYQPKELNLPDVGYHVAGFDRKRQARLYHVFWGFDRPRPANQTSPKYEIYPQHPSHGIMHMLYNGRNDLAERLITLMLEQIKAKEPTRFNLENHVDVVCLGDFVARFAAELTPVVDRPFHTFLISPENKIERLTNDRLCPLKRDDVARKLRKLGITL